MKHIFSKVLITGVLFTIVFAFNSFAQDIDKNAVISLKHKSDLMKREMSYRVILPKKYNSEKKERFAVLYLLHGLSGSYTDWSDKSKLSEYSTNYDLIIVMPDGKNGWYSNSGVIKNDKYENYIVHELISKIDTDFRTEKSRNGRMIAGLSMGGYGSVKFGLKYPEKFALVGSFSGALRAAEWVGKDFAVWKALGDSLNATFGVANSKTRKENNIFKILEKKSRDDLDKLPFFYLDCGTEDILLKQNYDFARLLFTQKVPHEFRQLPGRHNWKFWDSQIREFLQLTKRFNN